MSTTIKTSKFEVGSWFRFGEEHASTSEQKWALGMGLA